eukprot:TRINITY_DN1715_c0_g1_i1.p1 TRINITY_DN1715_c0_g1~~TRINITY_DN1715_c0_g1_i1.p1  ORF type:complete len:238 (-),score=54.04 TRINITY_DN1715_c0_g1_i1:66-779(-)
MSSINVTNIEVLNNPATLVSPFQFEITFDCVALLDEDLEWTLTYVGSAESKDYDQILDSILLGPVSIGQNKFVFQANAPDIEKIPKSEILGVTVVLISCSYKNQEFFRVGYYVNNEIEPKSPEEPKPEITFQDNKIQESKSQEEEIPIDLSKVVRNICADMPRVTRFNIDWGGWKKEDIAPVLKDAEGEALSELESDVTTDHFEEGEGLEGDEILDEMPDGDEEDDDERPSYEDEEI